MTDDTTKSAVETAEQVKQRVKKWVYKPPEAMSNYLWELFLFLSDHFTDSNSKAEAQALRRHRDCQLDKLVGKSMCEMLIHRATLKEKGLR